MAQNKEQTGNHKNDIDLIPLNKWGEDIEIDEELVKRNFIDIKEKIAPCKPRIIGVTKYYGLNAIIEGYNAGIRDFGESRAVEAREKILALPEEIRRNSTFHFIGHLQKNKIEKVLKIFNYIHSVDTFELAKMIAIKNSLNKDIKILLQVNLSGEETKSGFTEEVLIENYNEILNIKNLNVVGLMQMLPYRASDAEQHQLFKRMRLLRNDLEKTYDVELPELSMGMSDDYPIAAQEGATMIRIGRKLFKE